MKTTAHILFAFVAVASFTAFPVFAADPATKKQPNILVFFADDLGYADVGYHGCKDVPTPNIDTLAKNGVRFTSGYVTAPICSPSRAGLLSGRQGTRFGFETNIGGSAKNSPTPLGIPVTEKIFPERMKAAGYATGMFGKWHVGYARELQPRQRGFDWFYGFLGPAYYYRVQDKDLGKSLINPPADKGKRYSTEAFSAEANAFIEKHRDQPWFVYLAYNAVHGSPDGKRRLVPVDAGKYADRFPNIKSEQRRIFAGMLSALDDGIGAVMAKLRELKLEENTLVFFLSDNGGPTWQTTSRNDPLSGSKGQLLEGGIREPFCVQWKGRLPAGKVYDYPVSALDILPTSLAAIGAPADPKLEGVNLLPYLTGEKTGAPHKMLAWRFGAQRAVRMGDWKLLDQGKGWRLYNLATDIAEKNDLSQQQPAKVKELQAAYNEWNAKNIPPKWGWQSSAIKGAKNEDD